MSSYICSVLLGEWGCITGRGGSICEDDGTIWYGTQAGKVENCAKKNYSCNGMYIAGMIFSNTL